MARNVEQDLDDEFRDHIEQETAHNIARGMTLAEARRQAILVFDGIERSKEECRDARPFRLLDDLIQDLRYGLRMIRRAPGVSAITIASLALGISANTIAFSLVDNLVAHTLPVPRPNELVNVRELWPDSQPRTEAPTWEYVGLRDGVAGTVTISAIAVLDRSNITLSTPGGARADGGRARVAIVSGNYFPMLEVPAAIGRTLGLDDDRTPGGHPVVVLSDAYWTSRLDRSSEVLSDTLTINDTTFLIVGVMPRGFGGTLSAGPSGSN